MTNAKKKFDLHVLTECALMVALATVLSLIKVYEAPFGGSVTLLSMAPIIILSMHRGLGAGLAAGFVHSVIQLILGLSNVGWVPDLGGKVLCILFDYILPFTLLGLGGFLRSVKFTKNDQVNIIIQSFIGALIVGLIRYICHIISGVAVWYALDLEWYADDPYHIVNQYTSWAFSSIYNGSFMIPEIIETCVGVPIICAALSKILKKK
ncbi:MAG: energy-coupled thiamine transporter ThiT [Eubacteriales bacterium]